MTRESFHNVFAVDLRSLALLRVALAALGLIDLVIRAGDLGAFYTDQGAFPRQAALEYYRSKTVVSLHLLSGDSAIQAALFLVAGVALVALLLGYRTRMAAFWAFVLLASIHVRTPPLLQAGDTLLRVLFFWSLFLPLGARCSLDAVLNPRPSPPSSPSPPLATHRHFSVGSAALLLQVAMVYVCSALFKTGAEWRVDGTAIYYALQLDYMVTPVGAWLRQWNDLLPVLTRLVYYFELIAPFFLFCPVFSTALRGLLLPAFAVMHLAFGLCLQIGLFPWVSAAALIPFIPAVAWDWLGRRIAAKGVRLGEFARAFLPLRDSSHQTGRIGSAACAFFLLYTAAWNAASLPQTAFAMPASLKWIGELTQLEQTWDMFAPQPSQSNGWFIMPGLLADGTAVDVYRRTISPPERKKPRDGSAYFANYRWRKFLLTLAHKQHESYRFYYGRYLCQQWNAGRRGDERLKTFSIYFAEEKTLLYPAAEQTVEVLLWRHDCFKRAVTVHRPQ